MQTIINAVLFQATWFACVLGGSIWGVSALGVLLIFTLLQNNWRQDLMLVAIATGVGAVLDTLWIQFAILDFGTIIAPLWILFMWMGLALTVNHSLAFLKQKPLLAATLAAGSAPLSYFAGERLGAVQIVDPYGIVLISLVWGMLFYITFRQTTLPYAES